LQGPNEAVEALAPEAGCEDVFAETSKRPIVQGGDTGGGALKIVEPVLNCLGEVVYGTTHTDFHASCLFGGG
jgi:hypothetical protein